MIWTEEQITEAHKSFRKFLYMIWYEISLPDPTEIQYEIAHLLESSPKKRIIIEGFRGVAKSFIACTFCVWCLWNNRQLKVLIVSASKDRADANAIFIHKLIETIEFLNDLQPDKSQRNTQNAFDVKGAIADISPSVKSAGIKGQITGSRADILLSDDVEITNNSATKTQRDLLSELVKEYDAIIKPGGKIIYLGTPQTEMSLYPQLENRGYTTVIYPIIYPENDKDRKFYGDRLAPHIAKRYDLHPELWVGQPTDPDRFSETEIMERRLSYGKAGFSLQFKLNTQLTDMDKFPLRCRDFIVTEVDPKKASVDWNWSNAQTNKLNLPCVGLTGDAFYDCLSRSDVTKEYSMTVMAIDSSGRGTDETAYSIVKYLNGMLFLVASGGFKDGYSDKTLTSLANLAALHRVNQIILEANYGDGMFTKLFTPFLIKRYPCSVEEIKSSGMKEARIIDTLEPVMSLHKLVVCPSVIEQDYDTYINDNKDYSLIYQLTRITKDRGCLGHDDRIDALAMAIGWFRDDMDVDNELDRAEDEVTFLERAMDIDRGLFGDPGRLPKDINILGDRW